MKSCPDPNHGQPWSVRAALAQKVDQREIKEKLICKDGIDKESQTVEEVMQEYATALKLPTLGGLPYGHVAKKFTLPIGVKAKINAGKGMMEFLEGAVA